MKELKDRISELQAEENDVEKRLEENDREVVKFAIGHIFEEFKNKYAKLPQVIAYLGARIRMSKTEFISCPGCGRTYFELEKATAAIKQRTVHLKGLKIGIMGCIVNGPGEMADADFGYVGAGKNRISLYVGRECVEENISEEDAVDRLVLLIRERGKWVDVQ